MVEMSKLLLCWWMVVVAVVVESASAVATIPGKTRATEGGEQYVGYFVGPYVGIIHGGLCRYFVGPYVEL